MQPIETHAI